MAGSKYGSFAVGDANIDNVMLQLAGVETGYCALTLTEMTTTTIPQIAAGSKIEVGGSLFKFDAAESITGSAATVTNYIRLVPSGSSITAAWTAIAPTWSDTKQGWYDATGAYRYTPFVITYGAGSYTKKTLLAGNTYSILRNGATGELIISGAIGITGDVTITGSQNNYALFNSSSTPILLRTGNSNVDYTEYITVKRPISAVFIVAGATFTSISMNVGGTYYTTDTGGAAAKAIQLNPGYYKLLWHSSTTGGTIRIALGGVFGSTASETNHVICVNG